MNKGDRFAVEITDLSREGEGIGRIEGMAVFVPNAIPGDKLTVEVTEAKKSYARAKVAEILTPSTHRAASFCGYARDCGGCNLQNISYEGQLEIKKKWIIDALVRIGGLTEPLVHDMMPMETPFRFRNKAQFAVGRIGGDDKKTRGCNVGFNKGKSHEIINCERCMIQAEPAERIAGAVRNWVKATKVPIYDVKTGTGVLRNVTVKTAFGTGEVMVVLSATTRRLPQVELLKEEITTALEKLSVELNKAAISAGIANDEEDFGFYLESLIVNVNKTKGRGVHSKECVTLAGMPTIKDLLLGMEFEISALSFYQVNPIQTEKLYAKAAEYAALAGKETVLDLYCGVGTIGLVLAGRAAKVIGIETIKSAVLDANRNAVINGIVNAEYICGKAEEELPRLLEEGVSADVVILDPPRAGCDPALLDAVIAASPARIVYVSCDPATLARDIKVLSANGYQFVEAQPVDMFPHSGHVETVVLMSRVEK
ncbi:MAG: 23S rRNA (uracil(1939)-C(5))-methyltransferase RlmD [Eubacteriales bacterium]|nr:23S rRNA (uracil(1939)-C(5))-methyltransferase RlmD [Eubacteriales bacterium]